MKPWMWFGLGLAVGWFLWGNSKWRDDPKIDDATWSLTSVRGTRI